MYETYGSHASIHQGGAIYRQGHRQNCEQSSRVRLVRLRKALLLGFMSCCILRTDPFHLVSMIKKFLVPDEQCLVMT